MDQQLTLKSFLVAACGGNHSELARVMGVSRQAVDRWASDLPEIQRYRLREIRPDWAMAWEYVQQRAGQQVKK